MISNIIVSTLLVSQMLVWNFINCDTVDKVSYSSPCGPIICNNGESCQLLQAPSLWGCKTLCGTGCKNG